MNREKGMKPSQNQNFALCMIFFLGREQKQKQNKQKKTKPFIWQMVVRSANAVLEGTWILCLWKQCKNWYRREYILSYSTSLIREYGRIVWGKTLKWYCNHDSLKILGKHGLWWKVISYIRSTDRARKSKQAIGLRVFLSDLTESSNSS